VPPAPHGDATVPGTRFHATGIVRCARAAGQPLGERRFRGPGRGNGMVTLVWPDGGNRVILFEDLTPVRYDQPEADAGARMTVGRQGDDFDIRIGTRRFVIPEAEITGR
jgi:hypothetical protein